MSNPHISAILAMDIHNGIGKGGRLPWHIPEDFKHFKQYTKRKICIMGRKTYEDILSFKKNNSSFLPGRLSVVLTTKEQEYKNKNIYDDIIFINKTISQLREYIQNGSLGLEICIIGGASLFESFFDLYDEISITKIYKNFDCDTFVDKEKLLTNMNTYQLHHIDTGKDYPADILIFRRKLP